MKKTYIIPVVHVVEFGMDIEVEAENRAQAERIALDDKTPNEAGYDWNRCIFKKARLGDWTP